MSSTRARPKREIFAPKPDIPPPDPAPAARPSVHDRWMRALGCVLLGVALPRFAIHFDKLPPAHPDYRLATGWLFLAAVAIWDTNRALALRLRAHPDWLVQSLGKILILSAADLSSLAWIFHALSAEGRTMFAGPAKDSPADSGSHRSESAES